MSSMSLWCEGLKVFRRYWLEWIVWGIVFSIILSPVEFWVLRDSGLYNAAIFGALINHGSDLAAQIKSTPKPSRLSTIVFILIYYTASYFFIVFYLQRVPIIASPKRDVRGLLYAGGKMLVKYLAIMGWTLLIFLPVLLVGCVIIFVFSKTLGNLGITRAALALSLVLIPIMIYFGTRYALVFPLAAEGIRSSLRVSVQLVRGKMWRIIANAFAIFLVTIPFSIINYAVAFGWAGKYWENATLTAVLAVIIAACGMVINGIFCAFICSTARILYQEKKLIEPSFQLVVRPSS